jgi:hypothetical protein
VETAQSFQLALVKFRPESVNGTKVLDQLSHDVNNVVESSNTGIDTIKGCKDTGKIPTTTLSGRLMTVLNARGQQ